MNTGKLRSKRVIISSAAAVAVLGVGGVAWGATADADLAGSERERVGAAATDAVGGGTAVDVETSDDRGEAYEVEVRKDDGTELDVALDKDLGVVTQERDDDADDDRDDRDDDGEDDRDDTPDADDRVPSDAERRAAADAALGAVDGGTVSEVQASDDRGEAFEVDVRDAAGVEWDVELDADFGVLRTTRDQ
jgi:uncharacterized membrane protein YkoI